PTIENISNTDFKAVFLTGNVLDNVITSFDGADTLQGGAGNDTLDGADNNDVLVGWTGNDVFSFTTKPDTTFNNDIISDFANVAGNNDVIQLDNSIFAKLGRAGPLNAAYFHNGAAAADANDFLIYDRTSGALIYDTNGRLAGGTTQLATLSNH